LFCSTKGGSEKHATAIAQAIATQLQLEVPVLVKSAKELDAIASDNPYADAPDHSRLFVAFPQDMQALLGKVG
jgi:uncharacterized protein (DUF1697 family)